MDPHQRKIITAAKRLNIQVEILEDTWQLDAIRLTWLGQSELVTLGRVYSHHNTVADQIAANKVASKAFMSELKIPVPAEQLLSVDNIDEELISQFLAAHSPIVAKPLIGTDGMGIGMHLTTVQEVVAHLRSFPEEKTGWLLEEQVQGEDLRLQYLSGKLIAACIRKPAFVVGDGGSSLQTLIDARNRLIQSQNPENKLEIDAPVKRRIVEAGLSLESVLAPGLELQLKDVSNMAQGGHAIDITDEVHPKYKQYLDRLAESLKIRLFSLDVMTTDHTADPDQTAHVLEFNAQPAWLHHTFSEGRTHDMPTLILKDLFHIQ